MTRERIGQLVFLGAAAVALALYGLTAPAGLPWNESTRLAAVYLEGIGGRGATALPTGLPHPIWGCYVQVFGGAVALSAFLAALSAGLVGALVNRAIGWRFAVAAALGCIFLPGVWNRAITGQRSICLAAMVLVAVWVALTILSRQIQKVRRAAQGSAPTGAERDGAVGGDVLGAPLTAQEKFPRFHRIAGWVAIGVAALFALVSATFHDYRLGEIASAFARGVVDAAGERVIVLNGVCDEQVVRELESKLKLKVEVEERNLTSDPGCAREVTSTTGKDVHSSTSTQNFNFISTQHFNFISTQNFNFILLKNTDANRVRLAAWVRSAFPAETNLWIAATVSPQAFVDAAMKKYPERFYLMDGTSTTLQQWENRWREFKPYLKSSDPFVPVARRMFAYEGNAVANAICDGKVKGQRSGRRSKVKGQTEDDHLCLTSDLGPLTSCSTSDLGPLTSSSTAWRMYKRIYTEVDPGNFSALVNLNEMIRRGYAASGDERQRVQTELEKILTGKHDPVRLRRLARAAGPVRADAAQLERMRAEAKVRIAARIAAGEKVEIAPEILTLVEWNNEMVRLMEKGEIVAAGRIARVILTNPKWRDFIPANAVLGSVTAREGDYAASAAFFRVAMDTTNAVPAVVLNDFADVLMHLDKLDEAEKLARRAVESSDEGLWVARLTLAQILRRKKAQQVKGQRSEVRQRNDSLDSEIKTLLRSALKQVPAETRTRIRKEYWDYQL